jgi:serine phosphatase RsbU (regulator of sigma subunit)
MTRVLETGRPVQVPRHLPPLIRSATGGAVRAVQLAPAAPLGLRIGGFTETAVPLAPGDTLVMFTDGLVETRHQDLRTGIAALADALERLGAQPDLDALADQLLAAMRRRSGHGDDDTALVLTRPDPAR